jgi:hypothetical protein
MNEENGVRFLLDEKNQAANFIYRPPNQSDLKVLPANLGVKFAQRTVILDPWYLFGGTKWDRAMFRLLHPIVYSKRGLKKLWRKIKYLFIKEPPTIMCRKFVDKKDLFTEFPEK